MYDEEELGAEINAVLNEECLTTLIQWLPFRERVKCERVCRKWAAIVKEVNTKKQTALSILGEMVNENIVQNFCTNPTHRVWKHTTVIDRNRYMTDIRKVLAKVPNLRSLHLRADSEADILKEGEAADIGLLLPRLEHFSLIDDMLGNTVFNDTLDLVKSMPNLFHLELRFPCREGAGKSEMEQENSIMSDALQRYGGAIEILSTNVPLNSTNCKLLASSCPKMRKLSLVGTALPAPGLNSFINEGGVRGKYLKCLSIVVDSEEQLDCICKNMLCLQSFHCVVNELKVKNLRNIGAIGQLRSLKNLFISSWSNELLDDGLVKVFIGCKQLSSLIINGEVSDISLKLIPYFCPFLKRVEVNNGKNGDKITDETLKAFAGCEFLYSLTLFFCEVTNGAVVHLLDNCEDLRFLRLTCNSKLTKEIFNDCIDFAVKYPKEKVNFILPDRIQRYVRTLSGLPRNLTLNFM